MNRCVGLLTVVLLAGVGVFAPLAAEGRDYISIVGSSTVYPFSTIVAERFGRSTRFKIPKVEATGTGGGIKLFCDGLGMRTPDIVNASRPITAVEMAECRNNGVDEIVQLKVGYDGIVLAHSKKAPAMRLTRQELFLALAKNVPDPEEGDRLRANPHTTWKEINASLPDTKIEVLGPSPTSGTRDAFVELIMDRGCADVPSLRKLGARDMAAYRAACQTLREDGAYIEVGENDNLIVQKLEANSRIFGIFGYSFLEMNRDKLQGVAIEGGLPTFDNIASGAYAAARPLFLYVKKAHVGMIPGIPEFLAEYTSERAWGEEGYLVDKGLVPASREERAATAAEARRLRPMVLDNRPVTRR